jgi:hypothetical protein
VAGRTQIGDAGVCGLPGGPICCLDATYTAANVAQVNHAGGTACCAGGEIGPGGGLAMAAGASCSFFCDCDTSIWVGSDAIRDTCMGGVCAALPGDPCGDVPGAPNPVPCWKGTCQAAPGETMKTCSYADAGTATGPCATACANGFTYVHCEPTTNIYAYAVTLSGSGNACTVTFVDAPPTTTDPGTLDCATGMLTQQGKQYPLTVTNTNIVFGPPLNVTCTLAQ